jgi:hypothetical protein
VQLGSSPLRWHDQGQTDVGASIWEAGRS